MDVKVYTKQCEFHLGRLETRDLWFRLWVSDALSEESIRVTSGLFNPYCLRPYFTLFIPSVKTISGVAATNTFTGVLALHGFLYSINNGCCDPQLCPKCTLNRGTPFRITYSIFNGASILP